MCIVCLRVDSLLTDDDGQELDDSSGGPRLRSCLVTDAYTRTSPLAMSRSTLLVVVLSALLMQGATEQATDGATSRPATRKGAGPYTPIAAMVQDPLKRSSFFKLLKKMKGLKTTQLAEAEQNSTRRALNGEMQVRFCTARAFALSGLPAGYPVSA